MLHAGELNFKEKQFIQFSLSPVKFFLTTACLVSVSWSKQESQSLDMTNSTISHVYISEFDILSVFQVQIDYVEYLTVSETQILATSCLDHFKKISSLEIRGYFYCAYHSKFAFLKHIIFNRANEASMHTLHLNSVQSTY